jgi:RHS repeat-associated protein
VREVYSGNSTYRYYVGSWFEHTITSAGGAYLSYYRLGGLLVAQRASNVASPFYLKVDALGSVVGSRVGTFNFVTWYYPFGSQRYTNDTYNYNNSEVKFTGQRMESSSGLYYFNARWYDPYLNRWIQPDSIVPDPYDPGSWDRYNYVRSNPIKFNDPTGHDVGCGGRDGGDCRGIGTYSDDLVRDEILAKFKSLVKRVGPKLSDLDAFAQLLDFASSFTPNNARRFIENLGAVVTGLDGNSALGEIGNSRGWIQTYDRRYLDIKESPLQDGGFAKIFRDAAPNQTTRNQVRHFWFYVQVRAESGLLAAYLANSGHETFIPLGRAGKSYNDLVLGFEGSQLGYDLSSGVVQPSDSGNYILQRLAPNSQSANYWNNSFWLRGYYNFVFELWN